MQGHQQVLPVIYDRQWFENIQTFSFSNIDKFSTPSLVTRMTTDVTNLQNSYQMLLRMCVRAPFSLICAMIMSFSVNVKLASIYLVAVIILGAASCNYYLEGNGIFYSNV